MNKRIDALNISKLLTILNIYISILILNKYAELSSLAYLGYGVAVVALSLATVSIIQKYNIRKLSPDKILATAGVFSIILSIMINTKSENTVDGLKILSVFIFYLSGRLYYEKNNTFSVPKISGYIFVSIPILFSIFDFTIQKNLENSISIFANRNNAVLFCVTSSLLLAANNINKSVLLYYTILSTMIFRTLGAFFAILASIALTTLKPRKLLWLSLSILPISIIATLLHDYIPILERLVSAIQGIKSIFTGNAIDIARNTSYAEASIIAGSSDISYFFRLKHWVELFDIYIDSGPLNFLLGYGINSSVELTSIGLLPHNDYLRILFETGIITLICFIGLNYKIFKSLRNTNYAIPSTFVIIYFFSENIANNFIVMSFFFYTAGALVSSKAKNENT